jgi:hypothetical protein
MSSPMPASGWEARVILATAQEFFDGVQVPRGDRAAITAAKHEVRRARTIVSDARGPSSPTPSTWGAATWRDASPSSPRASESPTDRARGPVTGPSPTTA